MILIIGTSLWAEDLPGHAMLDYQIANDCMAVKLRALVKKPTCFKVFIVEARRDDYTVTQQLLEKVTYFVDDDDLLAKLNELAGTSGKDANTGGSEEVAAEPESVAASGAEDVPESVAASGAEDVPESVPESGTEDVPESVAESGTEDVPESVTENVPESVPESALDERGSVAEVVDDTENAPSVSEAVSDGGPGETVPEVEGAAESGVVDAEAHTPEVVADEIGTAVVEDDPEVVEDEPGVTNEIEPEVVEDEPEPEVVEDEPEPEPEPEVAAVEATEVKDASAKAPVGTVSEFPLGYSFPKGMDMSIPDVDDLISGDSGVAEPVQIEEAAPVSLTIGEPLEGSSALEAELERYKTLLAQKDSEIDNLRASVESNYKAQELQLSEVEQAWRSKFTELKSVTKKLQGELKVAKALGDTQGLGRFAGYAKTPKGIFREDLPEDKLQALRSLKSTYTVFAAGSGDSWLEMLLQLRSWLQKGKDCFVIDFTGESSLASYCKVSSVNSTMLLNESASVSIDQLFIPYKQNPRIRILPGSTYNDISLLTADWVSLLQRIDAVTQGKPVLFLFPCVGSFSVRYALTVLGNIAKRFIFCRCESALLVSTVNSMQFLARMDQPTSLVLTRYTESVAALVRETGNMYPSYVFEKDVAWDKLGI